MWPADKLSVRKYTMGGGDRDDDCDSLVSSFSVMSDGEYNEKEKVDKLRAEIGELLKKHKKPLNVVVVGTPGIGKSSFLNTISAALCGHWHEHSYSGKYGGEGRPVSFFVQRFPDCCLSDEDDRKKYADGKLPTLIDLAGLPDEKNDLTEEILRMLLYGRLAENASVARAEEIGKTQGIEGLRKAFPSEDRKLKVDRVVFLASASEKIPDKLISCLVRAARPSGGSDNSRMRSIPVFGVMTKMDTVDQCEDLQAKVAEFAGCLGLQGSEQRLMKCSNYCSTTAPKRTERNYPELDIPVLTFIKQLADPFIKVIHDQEVEDFSHLNPPKPAPPPADFARVMQEVRDGVSQRVGRTIAVASAMALFGALCLLGAWLSSSPQLDMKSLQLTCTRVHDMRKYGESSLRDFPELEAVCTSLTTAKPCTLGCCMGLFLLIAAGAMLFFGHVKQTPVAKKDN